MWHVRNLLTWTSSDWHGTLRLGDLWKLMGSKPPLPTGGAFKHSSIIPCKDDPIWMGDVFWTGWLLKHHFRWPWLTSFHVGVWWVRLFRSRTCLLQKKDTWRLKLSQNWGCSFRSLLGPKNLGSNLCYVVLVPVRCWILHPKQPYVLEVFDLSLFEMIDCFPRHWVFVLLWEGIGEFDGIWHQNMFLKRSTSSLRLV